MKKSPLLLRRWKLIALGVGALAVAGYTYHRLNPGEQAPTYQTAEATRGDIEVTISAAGTVTPRETVSVGAQVSGQLEELLVEVGDHVEVGDLLAQIDATIAMTSVEANRAQLRELQASRKQQQASLDLARAEAERAQMLFDADALARADYESAQASFAIAQGQLEGIDAQIERQTSTLQADIAELEFTKIYAPITGTVTALEATEGQTLNANQTAPTILTIADLSVMTVEADVSEADVMRIENGQQAWFTTLGDSERRWETEVRQVLPTPEVLNDVVLYKALLDIDNPAGQLKPEMTAQVFFVTGSATDAVLVPIAALQAAPERPAVESPAVADSAGGGDRRGGFMQADASTPTAGGPARPADVRRDGFRAAREANPDAEIGMVLVMGDDGEPMPRPVLVGLKTRSQAEIVYGLEAGETIVVGQAQITMPARNGDQRRMGPPPRF